MVHDQTYEEIRSRTREYPTLNLPADQFTREHKFANGRKPVSFHPTTHRSKIRNEGKEKAAPGSVVRYYDQPVGPAGMQAHAATGETPERHEAVAGILLEEVPPMSTVEAEILMQYTPRDWHWLSCPAVEREPGRCGGAWVFRGTRIHVESLFNYLSEGSSVGEFIESFPEVRQEDIRMILRHEATDLAKYVCPPDQKSYPPPEAAPKA
jgi:uncharacterized protein (DUF433 family)